MELYCDIIYMPPSTPFYRKVMNLMSCYMYVLCELNQNFYNCSIEAL